MNTWQSMDQASLSGEYLARDESGDVRFTFYHEDSWCYYLNSEFEWMGESYPIPWNPVEFTGDDLKAAKETQRLAANLHHFHNNLTIREQALHSDDSWWRKIISFDSK
jgi:hypothetical protein